MMLKSIKHVLLAVAQSWSQQLCMWTECEGCVSYYNSQGNSFHQNNKKKQKQQQKNEHPKTAIAGSNEKQTRFYWFYMLRIISSFQVIAQHWTKEKGNQKWFSKFTSGYKVRFIEVVLRQWISKLIHVAILGKMIGYVGNFTLLRQQKPHTFPFLLSS